MTPSQALDQIESSTLNTHVVAGSALTAIGVWNLGAWWLVAGAVTIPIAVGAVLWCRLKGAPEVAEAAPKAPFYGGRLALLVVWLPLWTVITPVVLHAYLIASTSRDRK